MRYLQESEVCVRDWKHLVDNHWIVTFLITKIPVHSGLHAVDPFRGCFNHLPGTFIELLSKVFKVENPQVLNRCGNEYCHNPRHWSAVNIIKVDKDLVDAALRTWYGARGT